MKVPVYVLLVSDPQTGKPSPVAVNEDFPMLKRAKLDAIESLELSGTMLRPAQQVEIAATCKTFRIVPGVLDFDDDE